MQDLILNRNVNCPACGNNGMMMFYQADGVPVHSVLLMPTREQALTYPKGSIRLGLCDRCGFINNTTFDASLHEYSSRYEETQGFSSTFNAFHRSLGEKLIAEHNLRNKDIIEIGCGKGEFLMMLCELGNNRGVGVDPAYVEERNLSPAKDRVTFIKDLYSEKYTNLKGDFIACKMTLEHIHEPYEFVSMVRRSIGDKLNATVFFMIPNVEYVLRDVAFWDIYYEHCSYFSKGSLARVFRRCGFEVISLSTEYDDQYLTVVARPAAGGSTSQFSDENDLVTLRHLVGHFVNEFPARMQIWQEMMNTLKREGKRAVIWGAGSKGVAFLTKLSIGYDIMPYAVDINPFKQGTFMAGTGQEIVLPEFLQTLKPDVVIVMNPIYTSEIRAELDKLHVTAELISM